MAKAKPFQYHTLMRVRKRQEDLKSQHLAAVQREILANSVQRRQIEEEQIRTLGTVSSLAVREFDPRVVKAYYQYERHLARLSVERDAEIARLQGVADERRRDLVEAHKRVRILEQLKDRRDAAYDKMVLDLEQKSADEVASNRAYAPESTKT